MNGDVVRMELDEIPEWLERKGLMIVGMEGDVLVVAPILGSGEVSGGGGGG